MLTQVAPVHSFTGLSDHDIQEVAQQFAPRPRTSPSTIGSLLADVRTNDYETNTAGEVTFLRVDPLRESTVTADARLQERLAVLCEALRSKY